MSKRIERDCLGEMEIDNSQYYGIQTHRMVVVSGAAGYPVIVYPDLHRALFRIKKCCAQANADIGAMEKEIAEAIEKACDLLLTGKYDKEFPLDMWQGGGYTCVNMNVNEVIGNLANELLTGHKGSDRVHPNTHVNMCQSSNDVYPTVQSIVLYRMIGEAIESVKLLENALGTKAQEFRHVLRLGRTCLQDAVPNTFGQVFGGWQHMIYRNRIKLERLQTDYQEVVLGATVLGTGMGQMPGYGENIMSNLSKVVGFDVRWPTWDDEIIKDSAVFDGMQNCDSNMILLGHLKALTCAAARICADLCILSSGPRAGFCELTLPSVFTGPASISGRDYPYIPEMIYQIMQQSVIADHVATLTINENDSDEAITDGAAFMGSMETLENITKGFKVFAENCILGISVNEEKVRENAEMSTSLATMVSALFGYPIGTKISHKAWNEGISCKQAALEDKLFSHEIAEELFDLKKLTDREAMVDMFRRYGQLRHID